MSTTKGKRLSADARRAQLERAAMEIAAQEGQAGLTFEAVAERAGVTRNLLYHYFPDGARSLFHAAVARSGDELTTGFLVDEGVPLPERTQANLAAFFAHAAEPSAAWRVMREAGTTADLEARAISEGYRERVLAAVARNNLGTETPSPLVALALRAWFAFAERALEEHRSRGGPREPVLELLARSLGQTLALAGEIAGE